MKRRLFSILTALALLLGLCPAGPLAAGGTITEPLDFTSVGDGEGQTPASGDGYTFTGSAGTGYTLTLNGISMDVASFPSEWTTYAAILLPKDGPTTIELNGTNTITSTIPGSHAIATPQPNANDTNWINIQGSGSLIADVQNAIVITGGGLTINDVTIRGTTFGEGLSCLENDITISNANITIVSGGNNAPPIYAGFLGDVSIINSTVAISAEDNKGIEGSIVTIAGGSVTVSSNYADNAAIICDEITVRDEANVIAAGVLYGIYAFGNVTLSQSEVTASGKSAAVCATGNITLKGMAVLEPSGGSVGPTGVMEENGSYAASAKLGTVALNVPENTVCTYGDTSCKAAFTTTPSITSTVTIYHGTTQIGSGSPGGEITIDTSGLQAGDITLTAKLPDGLVEEAFAIKVLPKPLTVTGASASGREYDGTDQVDITAVALEGVLDGDAVSVNTASLKGTIGGANAGSYTEVTLPQMSLTGAAAANYTLAQPTGAVPTSVDIAKTDYPGTKTANSCTKFGAAGSCNLSALLPDGAGLGAPVTGAGSIFEGDVTASGKALSYRLKADANVGDTGTITVPVSESTNYKAFEVTVTVTVLDKYAVELDVPDIEITYGQTPEIRGTASSTGNGVQKVPGNWAFEGSVPEDVPGGRATVAFTPDDTDTYQSPVKQEIQVTVSPAALQGAPSFTGGGSGKTLGEVSIALPESWPEGTFSWDGGDGEIRQGRAYGYTFTPDSQNYQPYTGTAVLWAAPAPPPVKPEEPSQEEARVEIKQGIHEVPEALKNIPGLETPEKLAQTMALKVTQANTGISRENTVVYDVTLLVSHDGGKTWEPATAANFPAGGRLTITLPYPEGTDSSYKFTVVHMFTTSAFGKTPGEVEAPAVTNTEEGIRFTVTGLSPICVGWAKAGQPVGPDKPVAPNTPGTPGGGGSSSAPIPNYAVTVAPCAHGKVTPSRPQASGGTSVTLTAVPDSGYMLDTLTVTDSLGNEIKLSGSGGRYTFTMPARAVAVTAAFAPLQTVWSNPYRDVGGTAWYFDAVRYASENGLMGGYGGGLFGPDDPLSRAQLAQILYSMEGTPRVSGGSVFTDVADGAWCAGAITWAAQDGIVSGYGDGRFGPDDSITREQLAVMLWQYAGSPAATNKELHFTDADEISGYALNALRWAVENGVLNGYGDGRLGPKGQATRAQAAQMLWNFLEA